MHARVVGKLRVESGRHHISLPHDDWIVAFGSQHFNPGPDAVDLGRADEHHLDGRIAKLLIDESAFTNRAVDLPAVSITANADIDCTETRLFRIFDFAGQQNRARASSKGGLHSHELLELLKTSIAQQLEKCTGLAAGDDQTVDLVQLLRLFYQLNVSAQLFEPSTVSVEIALQCQYTNSHRCL